MAELGEADRDALIVRAYEVNNAAHLAAVPAFLGMLSSVTETTKSYTFKFRFKTSADIEAKVLRKRAEGEEQLRKLAEAPHDEGWEDRHRKATQDSTYGPDNVTDVLGCRYVTLYQSEIPLVVEQLLKAIEAYNSDEAHEPLAAYEFVIYTNRPAHDPLSITDDTLRIVERSSLFKDIPSSIRPPESRKSAYSSVHFVFSHHVNIQHVGKDETSERTFLEVQVRDIFEEGWGEVQHDLLYSEKDDIIKRAGPAARPSGVAANDQVQWGLHLNALKTFVDGCSQHASIIKANLEGIRAKDPLIANQSVSERKADLGEIIRLLRRTNASKETQEKVALGYTFLMSSSDLIESEEVLRRLTDAATNLDGALGDLTPRQRDAKDRRSKTLSVGYFLAMEAAGARVRAAVLTASTDESSRLRAEAEKMFQGLAERFPRDPAVHMRLGKIIESRASSLDDFKKSEGLFDRTVELVPDDPTTGPDHWIAIAARIDKGVSIWKQVKFLHSSLSADERREMLLRAADATMGAITIWKQQSPSGNELNKIIGYKAASNFVFYVAAIAEDGGILSEEEKKLLAEMVEVVELSKIDPFDDWFKTRDNLLHAYRALGNLEQALALAWENFTELRARRAVRARTA